MAAQNRPFSNEQPPVDPDGLRARLLERLTSLFVFVEEKGGWGGGIEPLLVEARTKADVRDEREEILAIGGIVRFTVAAENIRRVGFLSRMSSERGPYFIACEWPGKFDIDDWMQLPPRVQMGDEFPLQFTHALPEIVDPNSPNTGITRDERTSLDMLVFSILSMTEFRSNHTAELKMILESR